MSSDNGLHRITISNSNMLKIIRDLMYNNADVYLERKRDKLFSVMPFKKKTTRISVYFAKHARKWVSRIVFSDGKVKHIGLFPSKEAASIAFYEYQALVAGDNIDKSGISVSFDSKATQASPPFASNVSKSSNEINP